MYAQNTSGGKPYVLHVFSIKLMCVCVCARARVYVCERLWVCEQVLWLITEEI
jgi:hypothetical protein